MKESYRLFRLRYTIAAVVCAAGLAAIGAAFARGADVATAGCTSGPAKGSVAATGLSLPARLRIDRLLATPGMVPRNFSAFTVRVHVSSTCGQSVAGADVFATAVPYNQVRVPPERKTGRDGWATLTFDRLAGFPVDGNQQLLVMFLRARKPGGSVLAGISTRRLVSVPLSQAPPRAATRMLLGEVTQGATRADVWARKTSTGPAPTAAVTVIVYRRVHATWEVMSSRGLSGTYFWKTVIAPHALCRLALSGTTVTVSVLVTPSIGCGPTQTVEVG